MLNLKDIGQVVSEGIFYLIFHSPMKSTSTIGGISQLEETCKSHSLMMEMETGVATKKFLTFGSVF